MKLLAKSLNYHIVFDDIQRKDKIDPSTYFGKGKIKQIISKANLLNIKTIFIPVCRKLNTLFETKCGDPIKFSPSFCAV